jgi:dTDP-4-amino-4,6-dideoxygalactose transaminase
MKIPFLDLKAQYATIKDEVRKEMDDVLENTAYVLGKKVAGFEERFAKEHGAKHCFGVSSGTDGNHLVQWALGVKPGDEVIIPCDTFIATVWGATLCGAKPVFVDVDAESYNLDAKKVAAAITPKTRAIVAVQLYGQATDMDAINEELKIKNYELREKGVFVHKTTGQEIFLVEDCAQSHFAEYKGKRVGSLGKAASFSFYPGKNLGAYGEAGAVMTDDDALARKFKMMRDHGAEQKYYHEMYGHNYRMEALQGAVLGVKMNYIEKWTDMRRQNAAKYKELLADCDKIVLPKEMDYAKHVYHLFVIQVKGGKEKRDAMMKHLNDNGVATGLHYPVPNHLQPCFEWLGYKKGDFPVTEQLAECGLSLPMYAELNADMIAYVCEIILKYV